MINCIGLLRGINVGGHNRVPMAELRALCGSLGWCDVRSYIQSGNVLFQSAALPAQAEAELERAIERAFGLSIAVIVRSAAEWFACIAANPFAAASASEPNRVMLALSKAAPKPGAVEALRERASVDERVEQAGGALWIQFGGGAGRSKLAPALVDRLVGSPVTMRNWRTVLKLDELARASSPLP